MRCYHMLQAVAWLVATSPLTSHGFFLPWGVHSSKQFKLISEPQDISHATAEIHSDSHTFTLREQNDSICNAGVRQWTGLVDVSHKKKLFFWFFESRRDPSNDPVIIWLNGGPGGTSMLGLFKEIGPCLISDDDFTTTKLNANSWSNFASVLYIDQPAGVGFSMFNNGSGAIDGPATLHEAAIDFEKLLLIIFTNIFPQFSHLPLHVAGESFGGAYVPTFVSYIHQRLMKSAQDAFEIPIKSVILVDAVVDHLISGVGGFYEHFCSRDIKRSCKAGGFNKTVCTAIEENTPACERWISRCIDSYDRKVCKSADEFCAEAIGKWFWRDVVPGGRNPYDDRRKCGTPPLCDDTLENVAVYLNQPHVQEALGFHNYNFSGVNYDLNDRFQMSGDTDIPTTREVSYILNDTETEVLVLNGNNDVIVNTEGQIRVYHALPWAKQALFRIQPFVDWFWSSNDGTGDFRPMLKGGQIKKVGKLSFVTLDNAGHTSPGAGDAPESAAFIVECWVHGKSRSGIYCP